VAWLLAQALCAPGAAAQGWRSAQPLPPPPPPGETGVGVPIPLGHIGQISFWAPNRGVLITAGNNAIPAGLYYYNGVGWRELSTVCGGSEGRIAWAGENDFWTISDQRAGQQLGGGVGVGNEVPNRSLCHFENGQVVASYAEPIGAPTEYQSMDAAACSGPDDCWFGGGVLPLGVNQGAFHLHWNGSAMTPVPSPETPEPHMEDPAHSVYSIVSYKGHFYESVLVEPSDPVAPGESATQPFYLHRIVEGSSNPFIPMLPEGPAPPAQPAGEREPFTYVGAGGFKLSADSSALWALSSGPAPVALLLGANAQFQQLTLSEALGEVQGLAADPGSSAAWVSLAGGPSGAEVARIEADGTVGAPTQLPEPGERLAPQGGAGPIACPAANDCWAATTEGWLFHLGGNYPEDHDPYFQSLITYRPPDAGVPFVAPESFPEDDSLANQQPAPPLSPPPPPTPAPLTTHVPLFSHVRDRLLHGRTLALSFTLAAKSHVRLRALRAKRTVAATRRRVLAAGRHTLRLRLSRRAWPTKLDLQVQAIGPIPLLQTGIGGVE